MADHLGTPIAMYDGDGDSVWTAELGIYGQVRGQKGLKEACQFRWPGQYEDVETSLYYNRFRYYDVEIGAYMAQDPLGLEGGVEAYGYARDPHAALDVFGLAKKSKSCEVFIRFMSEEEAAATKLTGGLVPDVNLANGRVTRKAKWVSRAGRERPNTNRRNTHRARFETKPGTERFFKERSADYGAVAGEAAAPRSVLIKKNEPGSYGVGADPLGEFNSKVTGLVITKR